MFAYCVHFVDYFTTAINSALRWLEQVKEICKLVRRWVGKLYYHFIMCLYHTCTGAISGDSKAKISSWSSEILSNINLWELPPIHTMQLMSVILHTEKYNLWKYFQLKGAVLVSLYLFYSSWCAYTYARTRLRTYILYKS